MKLLKDNLIDKIWKENSDRPPNLNEPIFVLDMKFTGTKITLFGLFNLKKKTNN